MSYTLNQMELYALANQRMWNVVHNVRSYLDLKKGDCLTPTDVLSVLMSSNDELGAESLQKATEVADWKIAALDGVTLAEFALYVRVERQRQIIRIYEEDVRQGRKTMEYVKTARADFKSFLREVLF